MSGTTVLMAGTTGAGLQDHQSAMWAPRLAAAGLVPTAVWSPPDQSAPAADAAERLARSLDVPLSREESAPVGAAQAVIACLRGRRRAQLLAEVPSGTAVLVDKPTLDPTADLERQLDGTDALLLSGHHFAAHPSFTRVAAAVRDGEPGLLRAVMVDLVVAAGDGVSPEGDLRNIGVHAVDLVQRLTGPATIRIGTADLADDRVTFVGQTDRDVVVSVHVSRTSSGAGTLLARTRIVGSHGHLDVDLTGPALTLRTAEGTRSVGYGADSVTARLCQLREMAMGRRPGESPASWLALAQTLDAVAASAERREAVVAGAEDVRRER
ncbi:hypothetical protein PFZ55_43830 [Streptomyces sp. MS2A]|nr:hypothetical protein [Streptomyces sp. MS2A]